MASVAKSVVLIMGLCQLLLKGYRCTTTVIELGQKVHPRKLIFKGGVV